MVLKALQILHVATELYPYVRTGGLGDVLAALPGCQRNLGMDARLLLPGYPAVEEVLKPEQLMWIGPVFGARRVSVVLGYLSDDTVPVYVVSAPGLFDRPGNPYLTPDGTDWPDNPMRFGLLSWIAAALARGLIDPEWRADILQAHDWHAALAPAYVKLAADSVTSPGTVLTIHNIAFQGRFSRDLLIPLGIPDEAYTADGLEFYDEMCFMKAGLVYSDRVTTVSPGYAKDIATPAYGNALEGVITARGEAVRGILNGVDEDRWDPANDPELALSYDAESLDKKAANRAALAHEFGIARREGPLFGVVSRLSEQKGIDLILDALPRIIELGGSLVLVGSGDAPLEAALLEAAEASPSCVAVRIGFNDEMAHRIYAGADAILVPSRFEPCGLTQLYALRYGSPPIVRRTGGLGDTVFDIDAEPKKGTGFVFDDASADALADALSRMAAIFQDKVRWRQLQKKAMAQHFRWADAAKAYEVLYREILSGISLNAASLTRPLLKK